MVINAINDKFGALPMRVVLARHLGLLDYSSTSSWIRVYIQYSEAPINDVHPERRQIKLTSKQRTGRKYSYVPCIHSPLEITSERGHASLQRTKRLHGPISVVTIANLNLIIKLPYKPKSSVNFVLHNDACIE